MGLAIKEKKAWHREFRVLPNSKHGTSQFRVLDENMWLGEVFSSKIILISLRSCCFALLHPGLGKKMLWASCLPGPFADGKVSSHPCLILTGELKIPPWACPWSLQKPSTFAICFSEQFCSAKYSVLFVIIYFLTFECSVSRIQA